MLCYCHSRKLQFRSINLRVEAGHGNSQYNQLAKQLYLTALSRHHLSLHFYGVDNTISVCYSSLVFLTSSSHHHHQSPISSVDGTEFIGCFPRTSQSKGHIGFGTKLKAYASRKPVRKRREVPKKSTLQTKKIALDDYGSSADRSSADADFTSVDNADSLNEKLDVQSSTKSSSRSAVLQACIITSGLIFALGMAIRQVSHIAFTEGWVIFDSSKEVSFDFEMWHLELITGLVVLISSSRYFLLKVWPDFAKSSEAANQQILSPLQSLDYAVVAFLPGISEELLFRGALLPLFGLSWISALAIGAVFGALHLGNGRKYSFAIWATFVGFAYGFATIISSSVIVPMAAHSLNNLLGGILWRYTSNSAKN